MIACNFTTSVLLNSSSNVSLNKNKCMVVMSAYSAINKTLVRNGTKKLCDKRVAFTTPADYAFRLTYLLEQEGAEALWCPTVVVESSEFTNQEVVKHIWDESHGCPLLDEYSAIAFTSRAGITSFGKALEGREDPLRKEGEAFIVAALGRDAQLLKTLNIFTQNPRVKTLVPKIPTPQGLVDELGEGNGRKVLCPVPWVVGLDEPFVVPDFFKALQAKGWHAVRLNAYVTRWAGPECAESLLELEEIDAIVFTSTAEVQGLLKSLCAFGVEWNAFRDRHPSMLVAAHGPVTASGACKLGVQIDVVGKQFHSFAGVVDALALCWG